MPPSVPAPEAIAAVTETPPWATSLPWPSRTWITGCRPKGVPIWAVSDGWVSTASRDGAPETPVALIRWGTTDAQETVIGRLDEIATRPDAVRLGPPVVVVIGDVVGLRERLASFAGVPDGEAEARPPQLRELALQR